MIIVGAGSSGAVIASRVSERGDRRTLLLEAGPDYPDPSTLPEDLADGTKNSMTAHDWGYRHRPTRGQMLFYFPRGRVVGGSSAVNTCIALRGQPWDFDEWAARGLSEWTWQRCLPAFNRLERDLDYGDQPYHGAEGPLPLRRHPPEELVPWQAAFLEACDIVGFARCADSNAPGSQGAGPHAMNKIEGRRISAAEAWLTPRVRARDNLTIQPDTLVRRVLFDRRRVRGVEVERVGRVEVLESDQVVLCAGAINTPGILLRSGIGPRAELERLGVDPVHDLPAVGARLLDHPGAAIILRPRFRAATSTRHPLIQTVLRYGSRGSGRVNDMILQPGSRFVLPKRAYPLVSIMTALGKPRGAGRLHFPSADPHAKPIIDTRALLDPHDRAKAMEALQIATELAETRPMKKMATFFWPPRWILRKRQRISRWITYSCDSGYHPSGTVPMGADDDRSAATDGRGRVRGVEGLTVADASLFPTIPSSNIHLPVLMLAERLGAWLRDA